MTPILDVIVPLLLGFAGPARPVAPVKPKLVVMITVDQLRSDYLMRWRPQLSGGLAQLLTSGAVFSNAYQDHAITETAPGHSTVLSGRWPAHTGIITNTLGVGDSTAPLLEVRGPGASPRRFRGTEFYDWLVAAQPASRALSVSRKDRGAILPIGTARQDVYWYQDGLFTTSRYYRDSLPPWVRSFNALRLPFRAAGREIGTLLPDSAYAEPDSVPWENGGHDLSFPHRLPTDSNRAAIAYMTTSLMDSLTLAFALAGAEALQLGRRGSTELLAVSLSATDYIGHSFGPDSREIHDQVLRLDRNLGWFLSRLADRYGRDNLLIVLSADHGVTPFPEFSQAHGHPEARWVSVDTLIAAVNQQLDRMTATTTPRGWLDFDTGLLFVKDNGRLAALGIRIDSVLADVTRRLLAVPGVGRVDRPDSLAAADTAADPVARRWRHVIAPEAGIGLVVTLDDWDAWAYAGGVRYAAHGQPSDRDAHVPLIISGKGVRAGTYGARVNTVDIAPTLARLLGLAPLSIPDGRVLGEALASP
ncbi:MAG TPA: alkaline phosphatase family protein [Gemmatimonadales bacterium]